MVAVKLLSAYIAQEPRFKARFAREVEVLQSLSGGKIVPILGFGEQDAFTYIVMPFLAQGTLHDRLQNGGISLRESAGILNDVSSALQLAHSRGIVHRDVKPSNILLDEAGGAYLSDFGFAYVSESSHSLTGSVLIGTPAFMSPEQCRGESVDERSDQYC
jgi:serine/threonine-protein kinase PpkA